ncbi:MAG: J domain-containing protein, partial [Reyranella sp.]|nr:J domain-containing protein [Reyranella sp.]
MRIDVDHYLVLGVPRTADAATIRAAYVALAKRYHPDVATGNPELAAFNFRQITDAYQTLSDPDARAHYDAKVRVALDAERTRREQAAAALWAVTPAAKADDRGEAVRQIRVQCGQDGSRQVAGRGSLQTVASAQAPLAAGLSAARRRDGAASFDPGRRRRADDLHRGRWLSCDTRDEGTGSAGHGGGNRATCGRGEAGSRGKAASQGKTHARPPGQPAEPTRPLGRPLPLGAAARSDGRSFDGADARAAPERRRPVGLRRRRRRKVRHREPRRRADRDLQWRAAGARLGPAGGPLSPRAEQHRA